MALIFCLFIFVMLFNVPYLSVCFADAPTAWQMGFQDPATKAMMGIVDLHHDICFFLVTILILVLWVGYRIVVSFHHTRQPMPERFNHHTNLELVWAILPSLIVSLIALPSLTLIYSFDDLADNPFLTVKVIGYQWAWRYELKEHVRHTLVDPENLLSLPFLLLCKKLNNWFYIYQNNFSFSKNYFVSCTKVRMTKIFRP